MRLLITGCGSIGRRHARNLRALGDHDLLLHDVAEDRWRAAAAEAGGGGSGDLEALLAMEPRAVLVCTPPHLHTAAARRALEAGAHLFIEKPIAHSLDGVDALLEAAAARGRVMLVGYSLRFEAGLRRAKDLVDGGAVGRVLALRAEFGQYLPDWRPAQDYRANYTARRAEGGGIILDGSHEIDYVRWLAGEIQAVSCTAGRLSDLDMDAEDMAALTLRLAGGAIAEVHLDCVQRGYARSCKIIGDRGTLVWDLREGVCLLAAGETAWKTFPAAADVNAMYLDEMRHFLACVRDGAKPLVDGYAGRRVLEIALAAHRAAALRAEVPV